MRERDKRQSDTTWNWENRASRASRQLIEQPDQEIESFGSTRRETWNGQEKMGKKEWIPGPRFGFFLFLAICHPTDVYVSLSHSTYTLDPSSTLGEILLDPRQWKLVKSSLDLGLGVHIEVFHKIRDIVIIFFVSGARRPAFAGPAGWPGKIQQACAVMPSESGPSWFRIPGTSSVSSFTCPATVDGEGVCGNSGVNWQSV